jgi:antitoxin component of RelBE/YafQ-DinJ toxin-antitoxin module
MNTSKVRTNLYLNTELKKQAQEKLEQYGMNLSSFVNVMMAKFLQKDVDMLLPPETEAVLKDFEGNRRTFEKPITLDQFKSQSE